MPRPLPRRAAAVLTAAAVTVLSGCTIVIPGQPSPFQPQLPDVPPGDVVVVGGSDEPVDVLARNALADLETYWAERFPEVYGTAFTPLQGGYFSVDPDDVDPGVYPDGVSCGVSPLEVENNAVYCLAEGAPNSDSITYDRAFLAELAAQYGRFIPALVMAHEFGHAIQARVGYPEASIVTETQADCLAGAWTSWVADGEARHTRIRVPELDEVLRGYLLLRDPVGTSIGAAQAHGSYFDRVSAFQEGFDDGPGACRDNFGPDRVYTQGTFTSDEDLRRGGDAPYGVLEQIVTTTLPEFWDQAFTEVFDERFDPPVIEPFDTSAPSCARADLDLVFCPDEELVAYDARELARPVYQDLGDFAVAAAVSLPYALAAREQLGLSMDDQAALRSAVCLTGWYAAQFYNGSFSDAQISPGDVDEAVRFLLEYGNDARVFGDSDLTGFQLVDRFRNGFLTGAAACDVGIG